LITKRGRDGATEDFSSRGGGDALYKMNLLGTFVLGQ
jgi:hypothetical protein